MAPEPLYDEHTTQVGWYRGEHVFDDAMNIVALVREGRVFSYPRMTLLGTMSDGVIADSSGLAVAIVRGTSFSRAWSKSPLSSLLAL